MVHKLKKTFGLSILLKISGIKAKERDGYLLIKDLKKAELAAITAIEKYSIKLRIR